MKNILLLLLSVILLTSGCKNDDELLPNHAKGEIIAVTGGCYGEIVLIEVENPSGIGTSGHFSTINKEVDINYINAIRVPYFSKIGIPDSVPQVTGTKLYFEYREMTSEEWSEANLFSPDPPIFCTTDHIPPSGTPFIITRIISYN